MPRLAAAHDAAVQMISKSILLRIPGAAGTRILHIRALPAARVVDNSENRKENTMNRRSALVLSTTALLFLGIGLPASNAVAQQSIKEQLVGTWAFVSAVNTKSDGTKFDPWGGKAAGMQMLDSTGHFSWLIIRSDIPKLASNNRQKGTADEFEAVAKGVLSYFGTYSLDDSGKTLTQHVELSSFPNQNDADRIWTIALTGDELTMAGQAAASGGSNELKFKRVK